MMTIALSPELEAVVQEQIDRGRYVSPGEVIEDALRLLKERDDERRHRHEELQRELSLGLAQADRGDLVPLDIEAIKREGRRLLGERGV